MKQNLINIPKISFRHKIGNMLGAVCRIIDGLIILLSLGNLSPNFTIRFSIWRMDKPYITNLKR